MSTLDEMRTYRALLADDVRLLQKPIKVSADLQAELDARAAALRWALTLADGAIADASAPIQAALPEPCVLCNATGVADEYDWTTGHGWDCVACAGSGRIAADTQTAFIAELSRQQ